MFNLEQITRSYKVCTTHASNTNSITKAIQELKTSFYQFPSLSFFLFSYLWHLASAISFTLVKCWCLASPFNIRTHFVKIHLNTARWVRKEQTEESGLLIEQEKKKSPFLLLYKYPVTQKRFQQLCVDHIGHQPPHLSIDTEF